MVYTRSKIKRKSGEKEEAEEEEVERGVREVEEQ